MQEKIGRYEVRRELGRGGMATVFLAFDPHFRRQVAIKVLPRQFTHDPRYLERFSQEAQMIAALEHHAIVPVYDYGEHQDAPYLVMRYMSGGTLKDRLTGDPLPLTDILFALERLAPALDKAHGMGIINRDIKPPNILFDDSGDPYLGDFGIARLAEASQTMTVVGTPAYMSPEQVEGSLQLDGRVDIYSLGVVLYEALTGQQPYQADTPTRQMMAHVLQPIPNVLDANPDLPPGAQELINRTMAKSREDRYETAEELTEAVRELIDSAATDSSERPAGAAVAAAAINFSNASNDAAIADEAAADEAESIVKDVDITPVEPQNRPIGADVQMPAADQDKVEKAGAAVAAVPPTRDTVAPLQQPGVESKAADPAPEAAPVHSTTPKSTEVGTGPAGISTTKGGFDLRHWLSISANAIPWWLDSLTGLLLILSGFFVLILYDLLWLPPFIIILYWLIRGIIEFISLLKIPAIREWRFLDRFSGPLVIVGLIIAAGLLSGGIGIPTLFVFLAAGIPIVRAVMGIERLSLVTLAVSFILGSVLIFYSYEEVIVGMAAVLGGIAFIIIGIRSRRKRRAPSSAK